MERHVIDYIEAFNAFKDHVQQYETCNLEVKGNDYVIKFDDHEEFLVKTNVPYRNDVLNFLLNLKEKNNVNKLIYGKDSTLNIVSCEVTDDVIELFIEKDGKITSEFKKNYYWLLSPSKLDDGFDRLKGNLHYKYIKSYKNKNEFFADKRKYKECFSVSDDKESAMLLHGFTYFKGMKVKDVSILSFDIESTGLTHNDDSHILIISNTYRSGNQLTRKMFCIDEYSSEADMIDAWCAWVREVNPSIMCGHNIFSYDLPYMNFVAKKANTSLLLGRDGSEIKFNKYPSKFRKDGSQEYEYFRAFIYGREIVDTMFLAYHYDFSRKYESYGLKQIIKQEGLEIANRQHYDASNIAKDWPDESKRKLIKRYAEHDADSALSLYDLMIPSYFYLTQSIPKSFQAINYTATGSQINAFLIRSYFQDGHSLPKASEPHRFPGAISFGNAGIYSNVVKVDVASLYPSVMLQYEVYDKYKDPNKNFLKMVQYFTEQRLRNKKIAKETNNRYYKDLEQSQKIVVNSAYGLLGASGLLFNSPINAALVTEKGREVLKKAIYWASGEEYIERKDEEIEDEQL